MISVQVRSNEPGPTPVPHASRVLAKVFNPCYRFFDWLYSSGYNPLYRSGTLAVGFLFILLGTGLYLSFFYSVSDPYDSLTVIQNQTWLGRWIRALHRYATVATAIAILFHVFQLLVQGKNWGPRALAWVSGIILTLMFFVSAWSGYVMVWDQHAQRFAIAGTQMLAAIPILHDVATAAFDGTTMIPAGFFFMNLFLHVAVPVVMILFLWVHTARLSRAVWFPVRPIMIYSTIGLTALSILWPAPLLDGADLLLVVGRIPTDVISGFWIPWLDTLGIVPTWMVLVAAVAVALSLPWLWKPALSDERPKSVVDLVNCSGCTQCARDCPYEAIKMIPRADGRRLIAEITPNHCVSCGICAASCADFAIGPPGRTALDQRERVSAFCAALREQDENKDIVLVGCANNSKLLDLLGTRIKQELKTAIYPVECCGCLHTEVIEQILGVSRGLALIGCPARNCFNRDGGELLTQRIFEKRVPFLDRSIDRKRLLITTFSEAEVSDLSSVLEDFSLQLSGATTNSHHNRRWAQRIRAFLASCVLLTLCAFIAQVPLGTDPTHAIIRIAGLLPSYTSEACRPPHEAEVKDMPIHMRPKQICAKVPINYQVEILRNGTLIRSESLGSKNDKLDRPLFLDVEQDIEPGEYYIEIRLTGSGAQSAQCSADAHLAAGRIYLAHYDRDAGTLQCGDQRGG